MGAGQSSLEIPVKKTLSSTIDYIAANYILSSNFQDLKNLTNQEYCKNLVILTSDVINQYLTTTEIEFLKQRLEGDVETNTMTKSTVAYFNKNKIDKMDVKSDLKRKRMCIGIAKYYIQIFHIFNAIAHTINPRYTWKDQFGSTVTVDYEHRKDIPDGAKPVISKSNLCSNRLNALMKDNTIINALEMNNKSKTVDVTTKFCNMNVDKDGASKTMLDEAGIPELEILYYDVYNYNTGKFTSMSPEMTKEYKADLQKFYTIFTGNKEMPSTITNFTQIPLREFQKTKSCQNGNFSKTYSGTLKEQLYLDYAKNLNTMVTNTKNNQDTLLNIIDQLFMYTIDPQDPNNKLIVINPKLNNNLLNKLVKDTRTNILKLYATCEIDFFNGLKIFESIVEKQIKDTGIAQIKNLEKQIEETISLDASKPSDQTI